MSAFSLSRSIFAIGLAAIVGCGPTTPGATAPSPARSAPAATSAPTAASTPTDLKLTFAQAATADSLDPHVTNRNDAFAVLLHVQEGLVQRDPKTMQAIPQLATSWTNPDAKTWVFKLRSGVKFHNGEAFDAAAAKYGFDRVVTMPGSIGTTLKAILDKVEVVDASTLRVTTKDAIPYLLERIMKLYFLPPKESAAAGNDAVARRPIGTGPYKFVEWVAGQRIALTRNEEYWGGKPAYKDLVFREITETATRIAELLAGSVDVIALVPPDQIDAVRSSGRASVQVVPTQVVYEVPMDALGRGGPNPFQDKRVRQAMNYAVDREKIAKTLLGGYSQPVATFLNPLIFGHDPSVKPLPYDPEKAKQLLRDAGHPNGFETTFKVYPLGAFVDSKALGEAIVGDLAKVGVRASIRQVTTAEIGPLVREGKAGPIYLRQSESANSFDAALSTTAFEKDSAFAYYASDAYQAMIVKARTTVDPAERARTYAEMQRFIQDEAPVIFGWTGFFTAGVSNKVDWSPSPDLLYRLTLARPKG